MIGMVLGVWCRTMGDEQSVVGMLCFIKRNSNQSDVWSTIWCEIHSIKTHALKTCFMGMRTVSKPVSLYNLFLLQPFPVMFIS
jgi:hypothetical protein